MFYPADPAQRDTTPLALKRTAISDRARPPRGPRSAHPWGSFADRALPGALKRKGGRKGTITGRALRARGRALSSKEGGVRSLRIRFSLTY
jgi:hypothetical protein